MLSVVEVYSAWCGPCLSMVSFLKKVKVDTNDDRLILATVNSENIGDVRIFRGQSQPTWIFLGVLQNHCILVSYFFMLCKFIQGGKPVKLIRGPNPAILVQNVKAEFKHELLCLEGKAKRNLVTWIHLIIRHGTFMYL